ncbi:MAG: Lin1244/Lin1753 domain-containing protein [Bacteroidia bacterium]
MARPIKNNADYFPHNCDLRNDRRCRALRSKFSLEGYAIFIMLLEILTNANHFQVEKKAMEIELIAGDIDVETQKLQSIINYLVQLGLLIEENECFSSPILADLKIILQDVRSRDRKRKSTDSGVFHTENPPIKNIFHTDNLQQNTVFPLENTQSKVKESKAKEIKEKGNTENQAPIFFTSENSIQENILMAKNIFSAHAPNYVWEKADEENLFFLLQKIIIGKPTSQNTEQLAQAFEKFIQKLPVYWRTKKFTLLHLNKNFNEISTEILSTEKIIAPKIVTPIIHSKPEPARELSEEEKKQARTTMLQAISEGYEKFVATGHHGFLPLHVMYGTLVNEKVLKLSVKQLEKYRQQATEKRKAELRKPKTPHEAKTFQAMLDNFNEEIKTGNEKNRIDYEMKTLAVQGLFDELKNKKVEKIFKK